MASYLSLEEAAAKLGIPTDRLVELRSQGQVRGFRDGSSWKFPDTEIERLADELGDVSAGGSGVLSGESGIGSSGSSNVVGGDSGAGQGKPGSDLGVGGEPLKPGSGSDVNLVASDGNDSDVAVVPSGSDEKEEAGIGGDDDLLEIDSADLQLDEPAITHDSAQLDLAVEPTSGSTGPITDEELKEMADSDEDALGESAGASGQPSAEDSGEYRLQGESSGPSSDAGELSLDSVDELQIDTGEQSSLELMSDLDASESESEVASSSSAGDVLSELDLLSAEQEGSGLVAGDSENLLASGGGSGTGSGVDDALADDDDLVIADDDDDLVISSAGSDVSIAGDSGINLMSPSDSGLSLESEPLDLAGSSISALDLGAELGEGSGSGSGGSGPSDKSGSAVDFEDDEEFQLSPSGVGVDAEDSGSQVIEIEDSEAVAEPVDFDEGGFGDEGGEVFAAEPEEAGALEDDEAMAIDAGAMPAAAGTGAIAGYDVPFTLLQVVTLSMIIFVLALGGMLMTDLVRNMWAYSEPAAPVSSLTNALIDLMGWGK